MILKYSNAKKFDNQSKMWYIFYIKNLLHFFDLK